jgi:hypothetical protein
MRPVGGGVQFFGLVEVDWKSAYGHADIAASSSGCTAGATGDTRTAATNADGRVAGGQRDRRGDSTARARRADWTTVIKSVRGGLAGDRSAWGIMVPKS